MESRRRSSRPSKSKILQWQCVMSKQSRERGGDERKEERGERNEIDRKKKDDREKSEEERRLERKEER